MSLPIAPFNASALLYAGASIIRLTRKTTESGFTAENTGIITKTAHGLKADRALKFVSGEGGSGLTADTIYFVRDVESNTFKLSLTPGGDAVTIGTAYTEMVFAHVHLFQSAMVTPKSEDEEITYEMPDSLGINRTVATRMKTGKESFEFETPETKRLLELFDKKLSGILKCTAQIWTPDPQADEAGFCALVSEEFDASVTKSGDGKWGGGEFDKSTIVIKSEKKGGVEWEADADLS